MGLVPIEDLKAPSAPLSFLPLSLFFLLLSLLLSHLSPMLPSLSLSSLLHEIPTRRRPSAHDASVLTGQQIGACVVLSLVLWLSDRRKQRRKGMERLFGHRTASHLGRADVVQEKGCRCESSSRDRMASPVREVHGAVSFMSPTLRVSLLCLAKQYGKRAERLAEG